MWESLTWLFRHGHYDVRGLSWLDGQVLNGEWLQVVSISPHNRQIVARNTEPVIVVQRCIYDAKQVRFLRAHFECLGTYYIFIKGKKKS